MSAQQVKIKFNKTYITEENAVKAALKHFAKYETHLHFIVIPTNDGRFGVAFFRLNAVNKYLHFSGFNVIG